MELLILEVAELQLQVAGYFWVLARGQKNFAASKMNKKDDAKLKINRQ